MEENRNDTIMKTGDTVIEENNNTAVAVCEDCETLDKEDLEEDEAIDDSDTEEYEIDESDDGEAAAADKPCKPAPPPPKQGSCVGVLFVSTKKNEKSEFCKQSGSKFYCVHNGRLVKQGSNFIMVNHWFVNQTIPTGKREEETRIFYKNQCPQYLDIKTTPDGGCPKKRKQKLNRITPGECVGIEISGANINTASGKDMKNGRYKNWVDTSGKAHCYLPIPLPSNLKYIFYFHYPKSSIDLNTKKLVPNCKPARLPKKGQKILAVELHDNKPTKNLNTVC